MSSTGIFHRRIYNSVAITLLMLMFSLTVKADILRVAMANVEYPPFYFKDEAGNWTGVSNNILQQTVKPLGIELRFNQIPFTRLLIAVEKGEFDVILVLYKNKERQKMFTYSERPYMSDPNFLLCATPCNHTFDGNLASLKSKTIAVARNYSYGEAFDKLTSIYRNEIETEETLFKMLVNKRIDLAIAAKTTIDWSTTLKQTPEKFVVMKPAVARENIYFAFSKSFAANKQRMAALNTSLANLLGSENYQRTLRKYHLEELATTKSNP